MTSSRFIEAVQKAGVQRANLTEGICFKCGPEAGKKKLVPGHKICIDCHAPSKCHTCNPNSGIKTSSITKLS